MSWDAGKSQPQKGDYWASCPLHAEKSASFHVVEPSGAGGYFKCFGCHEGGTVIDFAMAYHGIGFIDAVRMLARDEGIDGELSDERRQELEADRAQKKKAAASEAERKAARGEGIAKKLWSNATPAASLLSEYLTARGVSIAAIGGVPATLRLNNNLAHRDGGKVTFNGPAMIGAIGRTRVIGVHRTWITASGRAEHSGGGKVTKQWIGRTGELMGMPVVLSPPTSAVVVGEGIETTLAAYAALVSSGRIGWCAEAALSRGAITGPSSDASQLWTPRPGTKEVLILGEGSSKNPRQARELYQAAAARLTEMGFLVLLTVPHGRWDIDADFADIAASEILRD